MKQIEIYESEVRQYKKLQIISELTLIREHVNLFEKKYDCTFQQFEKEINNSDEDFEKWDDYIEWKAYQKNWKS